MDKFEAMTRFLKVAQTGSFTKAAEMLNLPKSTISSSVNQLEKHLNSRLFQRSTRRVTLTEAGARFLPQCEKLLAELEGLENTFQAESNSLKGIIRVDMPNRFLTTIILPRLHEWFKQHPETEVRLLGSDYRIDPIKEGVDFLVRVGVLTDSDLIARQLGRISTINCVSPDYINNYGQPDSLNTLAQHWVIDYSPNQRETHSGFEYLSGGETLFIPVPNMVSVATTDAYLSACENGLGIAQFPCLGSSLKNAIQEGKLVEVLPEWRCADMPVSLVYPSRRQQPMRIKLFMQWVETVFHDALSATIRSD